MSIFCTFSPNFSPLCLCDIKAKCYQTYLRFHHKFCDVNSKNSFLKEEYQIRDNKYTIYNMQAIDEYY